MTSRSFAGLISPPKECPPWIARRNSQFVVNQQQTLHLKRPGADLVRPREGERIPEVADTNDTKHLPQVRALADKAPHDMTAVITALLVAPAARSEADIGVLCGYISTLQDGVLFARLNAADLRLLCSQSLTLEAFTKGQISTFYRDLSDEYQCNCSLALCKIEICYFACIFNRFRTIFIFLVNTPTARPVFRQGDESNACYQLITGSVGVYLPGSESGGEAKCVATMKAGDHKTCFGEIGLLEGERRSATLIAESDALQCAVVDRVAFDAIVKVC